MHNLVGRRIRVARTAITLFLVLSAARIAWAASHTLSAPMAGSQEVPATGSTASGSCTAVVDDVSDEVRFSGSFAGLHAAATTAALHGLSRFGANAPALLPANALSASASGTFSGGGSLTPAQVAGLLANDGYCEVRDAAFSAGEIRGQLIAPVAAPAMPPGRLVALALALGLAGTVSKRCARST